MKSYHSPVAARNDLIAYRATHANQLGAFTLEKLDETALESSSVPVIANGMEALYAGRADLDIEGHALVAALAALALGGDFFGYGRGDLAARAQAIIAASRRDAGEVVEGVVWPDPADDPAPLEWFVQPAQPEA